MGSQGVPWGWGRMTGRLPTTPPPYTNLVLDPRTQTGRYLDQHGQVIEMGKHGTNRTKGTASMSGGGDGNQPQPQMHDDHTTDYESD